MENRAIILYEQDLTMLNKESKQESMNFGKKYSSGITEKKRGKKNAFCGLHAGLRAANGSVWIIFDRRENF
ncbi:MAG: hypothetical protein D3905_09100 [Candidatus Electrothrix sp. AS4_5]|nr:hypothetical protein [Candidatus Electrothrix gigas]